MKISGKQILYFELICIFTVPFCTSVFGLPRALLYIIDFINIFLLMLCLGYFGLRRQSVIQISMTIVMITVVGLAGYMSWGTSFVQYIWGLRTTLRFFIFLINCYYIFDMEDICRIWNILYKLLFVNVIFATYQYFGRGISGDMLGGTFGTLMGASGYLVALLSLVLTYVISLYVYKKIKVWKVLLTYAGVLYISILAELKIIYLLLVLIIAVSAIISKPDPRTILIVAAAVILLIVALRVLAVLNPVSFGYMSSWEDLMFYLNNSYTSEGGFSRTDSIPRINELFFKGSLSKELFGYGLGQCDNSNIEVLNSIFYERYGHYNYRLFFYAMTYLEMGIAGLFIYLMFYIGTLINTVRCSFAEYKEYKLMSILNILIIIIMFVYNYTLRSDPGYIWMLACAVPLICSKMKRTETTRK